PDAGEPDQAHDLITGRAGRPAPGARVDRGKTMSIEWYAVHTYVGHEEKARENILNRARALGMADSIYQVVVPKEVTVEHVGGGKTEPSERSSSPAISSFRWTWGTTRTSPTRHGRSCVTRPASPVSLVPPRALSRSRQRRRAACLPASGSPAPARHPRSAYPSTSVRWSRSPAVRSPTSPASSPR